MKLQIAWQVVVGELARMKFSLSTYEDIGFPSAHVQFPRVSQVAVIVRQVLSGIADLLQAKIPERSCSLTTGLWTKRRTYF